MTTATAALIRRIRESVIGDDAVLPGPFGPRRIVYADYAASGRALSFIEDYVRDQVLPYYANTHSEVTGTGRQTTELREEARAIIHREVGGGPEDRVLFCGSGATSAIAKLVDVLGLRLPYELDARYGLSGRIPTIERPVVFIGPHEHHSNDLIWRESIATLVRIPEDRDGAIDLEALEAALAEHAARPLKIGSFSAGSNVTGALADTVAVTELLHRYGALAFWDYAAAGPYLPIEMNPEPPHVPARLASKDAIFLSPHKFVGGPGSSGVLVAKRRLFLNRVPTVPGGGTVTYVNAAVHHYAGDAVTREEGGTPAILGSIRAGLAFQLKGTVGCEAIAEREHDFTRRALAAWSKNPRLSLLGNPTAERLPIVSLLIRHGERFLHHNFVVALLNDLFGIQARGGCACAGPYGHALLGIGPDTAKALEQQVLCGRLGIRPGWVRLNFGYFFSEAVFAYIVRAVEIIASHGFRLLPDYAFDPASGVFHWIGERAACPARLLEIRDVDGRLRHSGSSVSEPESALQGRIDEVLRLIERRPLATGSKPGRSWPEDFERLRWFSLAGDVVSSSGASGRALKGAVIAPTVG